MRWYNYMGYGLLLIPFVTVFGGILYKTGNVMVFLIVAALLGWSYLCAWLVEKT